MKKAVLLFTAVCASTILLSGCTPKSTEVEFSSLGNNFLSMNTQATLVVSDRFTQEKKDKFEDLCYVISRTLNDINSSLSANVVNSSVNKFNEAEAGETVEIDITAYKVLSLAKEVYTLTDGYYNPAIYYNVQAYGFNEASDMDKPLDERIPHNYVIGKYNELSSHFGEIEITKDTSNKCYATKPTKTVEIDGVTYSMKIDLGGIGKGYAADEVNKIIDEYGFKYGYFSFGTSSIAVKEHYLNGDYNLSFTNPRSDIEGNAYLSTAIKNKNISTSGDYEQYFLYDTDGDEVKERYCHVFDPTTGRPVQTDIMSATVIGGSAAEDDALTTAIMAMGRKNAVEFINEKLSDRQVVFTYDNNGKYEIITNLPQGNYKVMHSKFEVVSTLSDGKIIIG